MNNSQQNEQEKSVLRWGGLAGIIGGVLFILAMVVAEGLIPPAPESTTDLIARFPDIQLLRFAENTSYLLGLVCGIPLCLALFWALKNDRLAPALFGSALAIVGLVSMIISATPHVAHHRVAKMLNMAEAAAGTHETLGLIFESVWGVFDAPLYVGFLVGMIGFMILGAAILGSDKFGKIFGWLTVLIGSAGTVAAVLQMVDPASFIGGISFLAYVVFLFLLGSGTLRVSKSI